jgi:hypothetical protein
MMIFLISTDRDPSAVEMRAEFNSAFGAKVLQELFSALRKSVSAVAEEADASVTSSRV